MFFDERALAQYGIGGTLDSLLIAEDRRILGLDKNCESCNGTGLESTSHQNGDGPARLCQVCKGSGRVPR